MQPETIGTQSMCLTCLVCRFCPTWQYKVPLGVIAVVAKSSYQ